MMFVTFEGGDKAGKTTQIALLRERLIDAGYDTLVTREPGGTPIAESIREVLLSTENTAMEPLTEALLYAAARAQHVREIIRPALHAGKIVVCDRFVDSSIAYQAFGRELGVPLIREINRAAVDALTPDRTYLLSLPPEQADARRAGASDRIEAAGEAFHQRVRDGFLFVRTSAPGRVLEIDASLAAEEISKIIWDDIQSRLMS